MIQNGYCGVRVYRLYCKETQRPLLEVEVRGYQDSGERAKDWHSQACYVVKCGKTQISTILRSKDRIVELYEANASAGMCQTRKRVRESKFSDVNEALYEWFRLAVSKNVFPDGRILCEKAKEIAERLGFEDFKASNGWLDRWKKRHHIKQIAVSGESGDVSGATVDSWKERLPHILEGYSPEDIWNLDETGCFWRALPDKGFVNEQRNAKVERRASRG